MDCDCIQHFARRGARDRFVEALFRFKLSDFFSEDNPELLNLEAIEATYNESHNVIFVIAPQEGDVFTARTLSAIEQLTEQAWQVPFS